MSREQPARSAIRRTARRLAWLLAGALVACLNPRPEELPSNDGPGQLPPGPVTGAAGSAGSGGFLGPEAPGGSNAAGSGGSSPSSSEPPSPTPPGADAGVDAGSTDAEPVPDAAQTERVDPGPADADVSPEADSSNP